MDRKTAGKIVKISNDVRAKLNRSIRIVMENSSDEEFHQYRRLIAGLMYEIYSEVIQPIYSEYPELTPDEMKWPGDQSILVYRLSAFDRRTGRLVFMQEIPKSKVRLAKKNAGIPHPFEDFARDQALTWRAASMIADLIGAHVNRAWSFYLSPAIVGRSVQVENA